MRREMGIGRALDRSHGHNPGAMANKLFRQEAIDAQREKLLGEVSLARPLPLWAFTAVALAFAVALVSFSVWGEYARRERVDGFLALDAGAARLLAPESGVVAEILAEEGDEVQVGQPLIRLSFERGTASGASSADLVQREISERIAGLEREQQQARMLGAQQTEILKRKAEDLKRELAQFDVEIRAQQSRLASARNEFQRADELFKDKFYSESKLIEFRNNVLDQQVKLESVRRERAGVERELSAARAELPTVQMKVQTQVDQIRRQMSELQQGSVQEEAKRENVLRAPLTGVLTNIAATRGEAVAADTPLALVVPKGSALHAQLLVPTRAIGFVQPGQEVVLGTTPSRSSVSASIAARWSGSAARSGRRARRWDRSRCASRSTASTCRSTGSTCCQAARSWRCGRACRSTPTSCRRSARYGSGCSSPSFRSRSD
jgi:membrane fusion protein